MQIAKIVCGLMISTANFAWGIALDRMIQDFVLDSKRIEIAGLPYIYNPSIVKWNDIFLMSFRIRDVEKDLTNRIGLVWLDKSFSPISVPFILDLELSEPKLFITRNRDRPKVQDPRLVLVNNDLYLVFSHYQVGRMYYMRLYCDEHNISCGLPICITEFPYRNDIVHEKNWTPFQYKNELLFIYSLQPYRIFVLTDNIGEVRLLTESNKKICWEWGTLRGGTPAIDIGGRYLAFFHSSIDIASRYSNENVIKHYFMGAYTFETDPPFNITHISKEPIIGEGFYHSPEYQTWKPLKVIFPGGFLFDDDYIWIFYGKQDHEIWVSKVNRKLLLESLIAI